MMGKPWKFKCRLCQKKLYSDAAKIEHEQMHQRNNKEVYFETREESQFVDYSEAAFSLGVNP